MRIGIVGAMEVEVERVCAALDGAERARVAGWEFCSGTLDGTEVVVVRSGVGKVNAGICVQALVDRFQVTHVVNTGIAGSLDPTLDIGDLVVSTDCVQHDFTVGPLGYAPGVVPGRDRAEYVADRALVGAALAAAAAEAPDVRCVEGRVASGDQFVASDDERARIVGQFGARCCEMEGAAMAQVCELNGVPFVVVRAISDKPGSEGQAMDYATFEAQAAHHCARVVMRMVRDLGAR